ncbi:uncharacterized protein LOC130750193 isoform X3 [Actinidia eriantha]|nr:uncharacterized protein LOC130750193 isoform X3 [Actinidia eriantha]XP_057459636.1 uncharacterized protein LOC130750193 isoform X3 [Actinidia eriantha]
MVLKKRYPLVQRANLFRIRMRYGNLLLLVLLSLMWMVMSIYPQASRTWELWLEMNMVESLLTQICDTTSIAEFELKLDGFRLYVTRDLTVKSKSASPPISAPVSVNSTVEAPDINGSVSLPSVPISKLVPPSTGLQRFLDKATDEGLVMLKSPRVGYFRRSRTIKGKRAPPPCGEGQTVKEGKPLCYIEQLGGQVPVVSEVSGEVIKILRGDGDPVGYGDALIAILPSFPGIKKLK